MPDRPADSSRKRGAPRQPAAATPPAAPGHRTHLAHIDKTLFRNLGDGVIEAQEAAHAPTTATARVAARTQRTIFGRPLATHEEADQRLSKTKALAVFSSDALSSVAYATEAILFTLLAAGSVAFGLVLPISVAILFVLAVVSLSYRQTIRAYPKGASSYIVAGRNMGTLASLLAAASLMTDYTMTVAVSVSAGVAAVVSALPDLAPLRITLAVLAIAFVALINLRGIRESASLFAIPTYGFLAVMFALLGLGFIEILIGQSPRIVAEPVPFGGEAVGVFLVLHAFAAGCSALTGVEAISDGVPAFKPPEAVNAQRTLVVMAVLLGVMFLGMSALSQIVGAMPTEHETILSQVGRAVFGVGPLYGILTIMTAGILILAANTAFADFPRLASLVAHDGFLPRRFALRDERLAFRVGILALAGLAAAIVVIFSARVEALIPLFAIGVFASFTLSQAGMVRHWFRERSPGWQRSVSFNAVGAVVTAAVAVIFAVTKFVDGAWIIVVLVPSLVIMMVLVRRQYDGRRAEAAVAEGPIFGVPTRERIVVVPVGDLSRDTVAAVNLGRTLASEVICVHATEDLALGKSLRLRFERQLPGVSFVIIRAPYRSMIEPLVHYTEQLAGDHPDAVTVVLLPEYIERYWWERILFNQTAHRIRSALMERPNILVASVPYRRRIDTSPGQ
jgi:amino acid transporter